MKKITIAPGTGNGIVYPPNKIVLDGGRDHIQDGSATGDFMETKLGNFAPVRGSISGMHIEGYSPSGISDEIITDAEGNLIYNDLFPESVNENNQWITASSPMTLYAVWAVNTYNVHFDSNKPAEAISEVKGDMADQTELSSQGPEELRANTYTLPGWKFSHWNTKPDGTGTTYADQGQIQESVGHDETITLYAQWERVQYTVSFEAGDGGTGTMAPQTLEYDLPTRLNDNMFTSTTGKTFLGWSIGARGHLYEDGATVINLCSENMVVDPVTGIGVGYTLTAQWHDVNEDVVMVTLDGTPVNINDAELPGGYDGIGLRQAGSDTIHAFTKDPQAVGLYTISDMPTGEYDILLKRADASGSDAYVPSGRTMEIVNDKCNVTALDYCTVDIQVEKGSEDHGSAWLGGGMSSGSITVLNGDEIEIHCTPNTGYRFIKYTAAGHTPAWEAGCDETTPSQTITVTGRTLLIAHIEPIHYKVTFDANVPDTTGVTGVMEDQEFTYGLQRDLYPCQYQRKNYTFAGWNTRADGKGQSYEDGEPVGETATPEDNLTTTHNATVTLYAQWNQQSYNIHYDSSGADSGVQLRDHHSFYDSATILYSAKQLDFGMPNYHFTGWNTRSGGDGVAYTAGQQVSNLADGGESITLYAQWAHDSYTVHYDANGGTGAMLDEEFWIDAYEPLHQAVFKKDGCTFAGWNTKRDGTGDSYADREEVMNLAKAGGAVTLYAQWREGSSDGSSETGDDAFPWIPAVLLAFSLAGVGAATLIRRKTMR